MNCPHCKSPNLDGRNYCGACGASLGHYCRLCGFKNLLSDRFCGGCGAALDGAGESAARVVQTATAQPLYSAPAPIATPAVAASPGNGDLGLAELLGIAAEAQKEPEEKPDAKVSQDDIDSLFGS